MEDTVAQVNADCCVTLFVHNNSLEPVHLSEGHILSTLQPASLTPLGKGQEETPSKGEVRLLNHSSSTLNSSEEESSLSTDRDKRLCDSLQWNPDLTSDEQKQLQSLLLEHSEVFALDPSRPSELGLTEVVQHTIDTGV